jgi:proline utilization trans-activator
VELLTAVYGSKGRLRKKFVISIKAVLDDLTTLAQELRQSFPLHPDDRFGGISRMPAHLHLLYYQVSHGNHDTAHERLFCPRRLSL